MLRISHIQIMVWSSAYSSKYLWGTCFVSRSLDYLDHNAKARAGAGRGIDGIVLRDGVARGTRRRGAGDDRCTARAAAHDGRRERRPLDAVPNVRHANGQDHVRLRRPLILLSQKEPLR